MSDDRLGSKVSSVRAWWHKFLPRFPAVLLIPGLLMVWAMFCLVPLVSADLRGDTDFLFGFPVSFVHTDGARFFRFSPPRFLVDLTAVLASVYAIAMAVDRLVFPFIRRRRRPERATPPEPS